MKRIYIAYGANTNKEAMKEYRKGYEQEMEERLESYKKGGKSV